MLVYRKTNRYELFCFFYDLSPTNRRTAFTIVKYHDLKSFGPGTPGSAAPGTVESVTSKRTEE